MSVVQKLKRLHKQFLLKIDNIQRAMIAKAAGVDNEEYLSRARTLKDLLNPQESKVEEEVAKEETEIVTASESEPEPVQTVARNAKSKKTTVNKDYEL